MRGLAAVTGILGGLCLVVRHFIDSADPLQWAGFGLLGVAVLCIGLMLVPKAPVWLQAIVAVGVVCLAGSVLVTLHSELDPDPVDLGVGVLAVLLFLFLAVRWRGSRAPRTHGSHSR
ncbi:MULTISPECIES: hypothetical protein [unclassified Nocardioides]|uniref:hypothetical protein n=1 Tax=unclassified Nocardioides TaxID=2615069 RepID=UPI0006F34C16|nr:MULTISPECIES: hypothetical protein [unclassified Nocardioides]KQY55376.1 hypothetical protein ASD30_15780 [Nocardioides sp. Root140]KQZ75516.1 hypothetical protein ASD66_03975 [Nocardioides sp. Root151]KRF14593.1 hypothetical protein ASH02_09765 [Nocardioides sp. Soil796]